MLNHAPAHTHLDEMERFATMEDIIESLVDERDFVRNESFEDRLLGDEGWEVY